MMVAYRRYGKVDASQEEVEEASRAAGIHEAILNFPDKYVVVVLGRAK